MQIIINQPDLLSAINISQKAISASNMQILSGILLIAEDNKLTLMSTDFDISIDTKIACTIREEGAFVVASSIFGDIVRKLPNRPITIEKEGDSIKIKSGDILYNLSTLDYSEFPAMPEVSSEKKLSLSQNLLSEAIDYTIFSTSVDDTRPNLMGVLLEAVDNVVNFASLDGYRLSRFRLEKESTDMKIIIPSKSLNELRKILEDEAELLISSSDSHVLFEFGDTKFYSRILEGQFVDYNGLLNTDLSFHSIVNRNEFVDALERISLLATSDKARLVKIQFNDNTIEFKSNSEIGEAYEKISCQYQGNPLTIAFNNRYILEGVKAIKTKDIKMSLESPVSPAILQPIDGDYDYNYLVLPVKLKSDN